MVTSRQVRRELQRIRGEASPEEFADQAEVNRATVYRIEDFDGTPKYSPRIETISKLAAARGLTVSAFFAQIEGLPTASPQSTTVELLTQGVPDDSRAVPAASLTLRQELSVACLAAAKDTRRKSVQALLTEFAWAFAGGKNPEDREDAAARTGSD